MIEVARIVTRRERPAYPGYSRSQLDILRAQDIFGTRYSEVYSAEYRDLEWITIHMDEHGIELAEVNISGSRSEKKIVIDDPKKVIELAQALMKAAESQIEYATASKALAEQKKKLDETFKDRISGLGLKEPDKAAMLRVIEG